jgi:hypothetical protein
MAYRLLFRRDTAANWTSNNPVLSAGEPGFETDSGKLKIGDGTTTWSNLDYYGVQFTTPQVEPAIAGYTGSTNSSNYQTLAIELDPTNDVIYIDTTGWDGSSSYLNYYLPESSIEGHKIEFVLKTGGTGLPSNANKINVWLDTLRDPSRYGSTGATGSTGASSAWYPFSRFDSTTTWRPDNPKGIWLDGYWTIDNGQWG